MDAQAIRQTFTDFFTERDHLRVASAPLTAPGDPTLLFTSAGMVPFKRYFMGEAQPPHHRLTSIQKCFRTTDIDEVGDDSHLTMFEMLGNFSLGDYFKAEAQAWAWELVTEVVGVPADRLVATVFTDDDFAYDQWRKIGLPDSRIFRYGHDQGNFWAAGPVGPCGPCSELHYDMRPDPAAPDAGPADDEDRFLEIWNLVFMQYNRDEEGNLEPLPAQNIDTGAGLERWAMMLQGVENLYETDLFAPLLAYVGERAGRGYEEADEQMRRAMRVVAEHGRAMTFLIADGALPSNEGRGYVLRRLIRRALYMADRLEIEDALLSDVAGRVRESMSQWYPELTEQAALVSRVLDQEEERFRQTLATGRALLEEQIIPAKRGLADEVDLAISGASTRAGLYGLAAGIVWRQMPHVWPRTAQAGPPSRQSLLENALWMLNQARRQASAVTAQRFDAEFPTAIRKRLDSLASRDLYLSSRFAREALQEVRELAVAAEAHSGDRSGYLKRIRVACGSISGGESFTLYDTYGLPKEVTADVARGFGLEHDDEGFEVALAEQRARSRQADAFTYDGDAALFAELDVNSRFVGYASEERTATVTAIVVEGEAASLASMGDEVMIVLDQTPFYSEGGGQVGDAGVLRTSIAQIEVIDTRAFGDVIAHVGRVMAGNIKIGEQVEAVVDRLRRRDTARNHTATHLLHAALREVLGDHVRQAGSLVAPDHLRFDYTQPEAPADGQLREVQRLVQARIRDDIPVSTNEMPYEAALKTGAMAIFGERYDTDVRVVEICDPEPHVHDCFSKELCGGTHVPATGVVGAFQIVSDASIGSGVRRIEALTGAAAEEWISGRIDALDELAESVRATPETVTAKVDQLREEAAELRRRLNQVEQQAGASAARSLAAAPADVGGVAVVAGRVEVESADGLRRAGDEVRNILGEGVVVLGAVAGGRPLFVAMATPGAVGRGVHAGNLIREIAKITGGGGGGKPDMAQAGGRDAAKLDQALGAAADAVRGQLDG